MAQVEKFVEIAWQHLKADRVKQAMECAKKAHAISPNAPDVSHLLGLLASRNGKPEIALPLLQDAINQGGKTPQRLRHMAEALLDAGYPEAALAPLNDAIKEFGESADIYGLKSAIEIAQEEWDSAAKSSQRAIDLNPNLMAWELNLSFAQLIQAKFEEGFKNATARPKNLGVGSKCPALMYSQPTEVWLKSEQGLGDTLFYLRYVVPLVKKGWQFHIEADRKLVPLLQNTDLFLSVKEKNNCPKNQFDIHLGDLPLMAIQCGIKEIPPPLPLIPDAKLVEKYKLELEKFGSGPYIGVTWRAGPRGNRQRAGIAILEKSINPISIGEVLAKTNATIINLQRLPQLAELDAFHQALGRPSADYSALNNNLSGMLALMSLLDGYVTVSNTNLHLREALAKPSHVFVNRPIQDWRWQAEGKKSIWYPNSHVYRQEKNKQWGQSFSMLGESLLGVKETHIEAQKHVSNKQHTISDCAESLTHQQDRNHISEAVANQHIQLINQGWDNVAHNIPLAIANARTVLVEYPKHPRALHLLGWAAIQDLKFDLGLSILGQAIQLEPNNGNIWRDYIRAHVLLDNPTKAIEIGNKCLENAKLWAKGVVFYALGTAYSLMEDDLNAIACFDKCAQLIPNHLDAPTAAGMTRMRMGDNYALMGFKLNTARIEARNPDLFPYWTCPVLKGDVTGLKVLIVRSMGFGDELSYLRYLPYLVKAGAHVTYWCGVKLVPLLRRLPYAITVIPDTEPIPDPSGFDLAFIKNELPIAVEHLGAPEIADSLPLTIDVEKLEKWRKWLKAQADGPYIGLSWSAGVTGNIKDGFGYTRLSKKVEPADLATSLSGINATWLSLTRNITKEEINAFEQALGSPVIDIAGITDDLDDLLCIQALLDENIGVSNTNMHLRACLGLGSKVLVSLSSRDWRWGVQGNCSTWFKDSIVYREVKEDGWQNTLVTLRRDLVEKYGVAEKQTKPFSIEQDNAPIKVKKIVWVTAGEIKKGNNGYFSPLASAQERVVNVAKLLEAKGWPSVYLIESVSELMGGWHDKLPVKGDVVVFSKVFTEHAIRLMQDARARGASVIVDVFNDFENQPARELHQQQMMQAADVVISSPKLKLKWQRLNQPITFYYDDINDERTSQEIEQAKQDWMDLLENPNNPRYQQNNTQSAVASTTQINKQTSAPTKRLIWLTGGDVKNNDGILSSDLASTRYRVISPSQALGQLGWKSEIVNEAESKFDGDWGIDVPQSGDTLIVSKVFTEHSLSLAYDAKKRGANVVVDLCDNHLNHPQRGALQKSLLEMSDLIVTSTQALNEALSQVGKQANAVISDPVEFKRGAIKFAPSKTLKLVWFGHAGNIDTLVQTLPALAQLAQTTPLQLNVVTTLPNGQQDLDKVTPKGLIATYTPWSVSATEEAITNCDIVIIPTLQSDMKNAKSPNRLLEALWAGRMVVAGPLPAYLHFSDSAWVGKDLTEGIKWCMANPEAVKARIAQGQADVEKYFTEQAIGKQWHALLNGVHQQNVTLRSQQKAETSLVPNKCLMAAVTPIALLTTQHPSLPSIAIRLIEPLSLQEYYSVKIASGIHNQNQLRIDYEALLMRDIIIVQRDFSTESTLPLLKKLKALGKKLVYETDDAFHLIPEHHSKALHRAKAPAIFEFAKIADAITVSTNALADEFKTYGQTCVMPNRLSPKLWNDALLNTANQLREKYDSERVRIGIVGGVDHQLDLNLLVEAIQSLVQENRNIHWVAYGDGAVNLLKSMVPENMLSVIKTNFDYTTHPQRLAEMAVDIALVPLVDDAFNRCRSNLKFLEFGFLGVATVFSNVESYNTSVVDGETGLLVNNTTPSWIKAIQQLIENKALREKLGANAQTEVQTHWILNSQNNGWKELLEKLV